MKTAPKFRPYQVLLRTALVSALVLSEFTAAFAQAPARRRVSPPPTRPGANQQNNQEFSPLRNQTGQTGQGQTTLNYKNTNLIDVIEAITNQTGKNYELEPGIGQEKVTLITHQPFPPDLIDEVLESVLATHGLSLVETLDGNLYKIVRNDKNPEKRPFSIGKGEIPEGYEGFSTHVISIQHADAGELQQILQTVGSQGAKIDVYVPTNTLILSDTADGIRNIFRLLDELDVPGYDTVMEIFQLEYTSAEDLSSQIQEVLMGAGQSGQPGRPGARPVTRPTPTRTVRPNVPGRPQGVRVGNREETLRMVPDERLNTLIVVASEHLMERVRDLVEKLDTPTPFEQNIMHYVPLLNADAEAVEEALNAITGTAPRRGTQPGGAQTAEVQPFEKEVVITRYEQTNALLIVAAPQDFKLLQEIIAQLDVPQRQVLIESHILQVTLSDNLTLAVEATGLTGNDFFALSNVVNLANILAGGPLAAAGLGITTGIIDGTTEITLPSGLDDTGNPTGLTLQTIPNVPLLLKSLEVLSDVDILSQPSLTTVDNEEARIIVGQEIPVVSSLSDVNDRTGFQARSRVERVDVGVQMTVTPQINEGDYVAIEVNIEVSEVVDSAVGIDPNQVGATFDKSEITNKIVIPDGSTGVIGGLISNIRNRTVSQVPILGDIPILGFFFRTRGTVRRKRNLVVLLTPHIIKEGEDLSRVTQYKINQFYERNVDALFEKGFIKKIKKKRKARKKQGPTAAYIQQVKRNRSAPTTQSFGRSDIN